MTSLALLAIACLLFPPGCTDSLTSAEVGREATTLDVEPDSTSLAQGDSVTLEAIPRGPQGNPVSGYEITWTSENTTVATVESGGMAVAHRSGAAVIKASAENGDSEPLSDRAKIVVDDEVPGESNPLIENLTPAEYETGTTAAGEEVYVDRSITISSVPSRFQDWTYVRTANDDKSEDDESAVSFTLSDTSTVALAYDKRATSLPDWLESWTHTGEALRTADGKALATTSARVLETTVAGYDIFTRVFGPGEVVLGGNQSGGAEGAESMYVLFSAPSNSPPDEDGEVKTGNLQVTVSTSGDPSDSDGYTVTVNDSVTKEIGPNESVRFSDLVAGDHQVELSGVQPNCSVDGSNPRTVSVEDGNTTSTSYSVNCASTTGSLEVSASTTGDDPDTDGYTVTVDGDASKEIGPNDSVTFSGLDEGDHQVELSGIKSNCSVEGQNPRTVTVEGGNTASTSFNVSCSSTTGSLEVIASTSGEDPDTDGYTVTVDGDASKDIEPNGTVTFSDLSEGDHQVELGDVVPNCTIDGKNPRAVTVGSGNTASTTFDVGCEAVSGLTVESATINSDGSQLTLAFDQAVALGPNHEDAHLNPIDDTPSDNPTMSYASGEGTSSLVFDLSRTFLQGESPSIHYDQPGDGLQASSSGADLSTFSEFAVTNNSTQGKTLEVSVSTSGDNPDTDGYTVTVDGDASEEVGSNGTVTFSDLSVGDHQVELSGIKANCSVEGQNPRTVAIEVGNTASTSYTVNCVSTAGALEVSAATSGDDPDSDGYTVTVDGDASKEIGPDGSATFSGLDEGDHQVELTGVADNCSVEGSNPRTVSVEAGTTTSTSYAVSCTATTGNLEVSASTSGDDQDSDGYTATLDGSTSKDLGANGSVTFSDLSEGDYSVELTDIASNCAVDGQNPRTVSVEGGSTASTTFNVSCEAISEPTIESATINSAGSQITLAFDQAVALGPNHEDAHLNPIDDTPSDNPTMSYASGEGTSSLVFDLSRTFLDGESPSIHYDQPGDGIQADGSGADLATFSDFAVTNNSTQGDTLEVSASTSGEDQDTDGYTVTVDGSNGQDIGPNGSTTFTDLDAGEHEVELTNVANNCTVDGPNPRTVSVTPGNNASANFDVSCSATTGTLEVSASTSGDDPDSDGYTATVDGDASKDLDPSGKVTFSDLSEGDHSVELTDIASNCAVDGSNPKTVTVEAGGTVSTTFNVSCTAQTGDLEVSASTTGEDQDSDGYTATVDGSTSKDLGLNGSVIFSELSEGDHTVELSDVKSNCSVDGQNPRTISVTADNTTSTSFSVSCEDTFGNRNAVLWEYEEWSLQNSSYSGNPFDVIATVTFEHQGSSKSHTTEMFYDGDDTWKFRFTGTRTGTWTFTTSSDDPELDGHTGTVNVSQNSDPNDRGFLTSEGNRFAIQVGDGEIRGFLLNIFQTDDSGPYKHTHITTFDTPNPSSKMENYVLHARERGFTSVYVMLNNNLLEMGAYGYDETSSVNPDLTTFQVLDDIVTTAHEKGMRVYFWRWGDETRKWTPIGLEGGINGTVDQRVTRYFAARLGPLPGWSMGYGFDLAEWTSVSKLQVWFDDFQGWLGWEHYVSARSGDLHRSYGLINGYAQGDQELGDFFTDTFPFYSTIVEDLNSDTDTPHLLEERNVLGRWGVDAEDTRRLMWRTAMARGMGGWYGHMNSDPVFSGDEGYPNPDQLKAHRTFWKNRFLLSFERANNLTDGHALASGDNSNYVLYKEEASSIEVDLTSMNGPQPAVAVNTGEPYNEIDLGSLSPEQQTIELPASGDWAIAIGEFPD